MAKAKQTNEPSYQELNNELHSILATLQDDSIDIDEALTKYKRGLELVELLKTYLATVENTVHELEARFSTEA